MQARRFQGLALVSQGSHLVQLASACLSFLIRKIELITIKLKAKNDKTNKQKLVDTDPGFLVTTAGGECDTQHTDDASLNRALETCIILLTDATSINLIRDGINSER